MAVKESKFNERFRKELAKFGMMFVRVESHSTSPGIPDNHFVHTSGKSGWVEMKEVERYPRCVLYQPAQPAWLVSYSKAGGRCATALHIKASDELVLIPGSESVRANRKLAATHHCREVSLSEPGAWKEVAEWLLL